MHSVADSHVIVCRTQKHKPKKMHMLMFIMIVNANANDKGNHNDCDNANVDDDQDIISGSSSNPIHSIRFIVFHNALHLNSKGYQG